MAMLKMRRQVDRRVMFVGDNEASDRGGPLSEVRSDSESAIEADQQWLLSTYCCLPAGQSDQTETVCSGPADRSDTLGALASEHSESVSPARRALGPAERQRVGSAHGALAACDERVGPAHGALLAPEAG